MSSRGNNSRNVPRRRPDPRRSTSAVVTRAQLRRENHLIENGSKLRPLPHPTDFESVPWFPLTVRIENANSIHFGTTTVSGTVSIFAALASQIGVTASINVRIQSVRVWGPILAMNSATALPPVRVWFRNLTETTSGAQGVLEDIISYPDQVSRAAVGFTWPKAQQAISVPPKSDSVFTLINLITGGGAGTVTYVRLLWRPNPLTGLEHDFESVEL